LLCCDGGEGVFLLTLMACCPTCPHTHPLPHTHTRTPPPQVLAAGGCRLLLSLPRACLLPNFARAEPCILAVLVNMLEVGFGYFRLLSVTFSRAPRALQGEHHPACGCRLLSTLAVIAVKINLR
jgi:hypothetical protein